jgi:hypothetical protein
MELRKSEVLAADTPGASEAAVIDIDESLETIVTPLGPYTRRVSKILVDEAYGRCICATTLQHKYVSDPSFTGSQNASPLRSTTQRSAMQQILPRSA